MGLGLKGVRGSGLLRSRGSGVWGFRPLGCFVLWSVGGLGTRTPKMVQGIRCISSTPPWLWAISAPTCQKVANSCIRSPVICRCFFVASWKHSNIQARQQEPQHAMLMRTRGKNRSRSWVRGFAFLAREQFEPSGQTESGRLRCDHWKRNSRPPENAVSPSIPS